MGCSPGGSSNHSNPFRVLFCGKDMTYGYLFTKKALQTQWNFDEKECEVLQCERDEVARVLEIGIDVVVPLMTPLTREMLERAHENLKLIIQFGAGVEGIDMKAATERGIYVANIPTALTPNAVSCAEMAVMLMLMTLRHPREMALSIQNRRLGVPLGSTLSGKNVLIIGFGGIAKALIPRLVPFQVSISILRRSNAWVSESPKASADLDTRSHTDHMVQSMVREKGVWPEDSARLSSNADIIVMTCKQTPESYGMINREFLRHCKDGVHIINVARGGLLDYKSIKCGLENGKIGALGLDVQFWEPFSPDDPIAQHPNVFLTPHVAGVTEQSYKSMASIVAREAIRIQAGLGPSHELVLNNPSR